MPQNATSSASKSQTGYNLDEQVGFILRRVSQRHLAIFAEHIPDLTSTQFAVLAKLCEVGPLSQNELGRRTAMDAATIKGVIDRLRLRGLVTSRPDPGDLRRITVLATEDGRAMFDQFSQAALAITEETMAPLDDQERVAFLTLLQKLV